MNPQPRAISTESDDKVPVTCLGRSRLLVGIFFFFFNRITGEPKREQQLKQQSHEIQNKATTGEQIKWGTNWGVYKSESQNVNTFRVYYYFSIKDKLNWQTDLSIYYLYDYACDFCILKEGNTLQLQGKFK